jgi:transmembrane sensor
MTMPDLRPSTGRKSSPEIAADWLAQLDADGSEDLHAAFRRWYDADIDHRRAFDALAETQYLASRATSAPEMRALSAEALASAQRGRRRLRAPLWGGGLTAAAAAFFAVCVVQQPPAAVEYPVYRTGVHERLAVTLDDGSIMTLDAGSRARVAFTTTQRRVVLETGQALFEVAKGLPQPFSVVSGNHVIVAHGTVFDVWRSPTGVRVVLVDGSVGVAARTRQSSPPVMMRPNEVYEDGNAGSSLRRVEDATRFILWRDGLLQFRDESLGDAVRQVNRYLEHPIQLASPDLNDLRISGTFHAGDRSAFVRAVSSYFGLSVQQRPHETILTR